MNILSLGALTLSLAPAHTGMGSLSPTGDTVTLTARREPGRTLTRTIASQTELTGGDLTVTMDGQDVPSEYLPELTVDITAESSLQVVDEHAGTALVRSFEALSSEAMIDVDLGGYMGQEGKRIEAFATSPLQGRAVRFAPSEDGGTVATFVGERDSAEVPAEVAHAESALLAGLRQELDLAAWLPAAPVAIGARWKAPAAALLELLEPGGKLAWKWSAPDAEDEVTSRSIPGEVELELVRVAESGGRSLATLRVSGTFEHTTTSPTDLADVPVAQGTATETRTAQTTLRGDLVWDISGGHLVSAELVTELQLLSRTIKDPGQEGPEYESTLSFEGTERWQVTVVRGEG
jgi:hypothetical protein